jgi:hypothetical protein
VNGFVGNACAKLHYNHLWYGEAQVVRYFYSSLELKRGTQHEIRFSTRVNCRCILVDISPPIAADEWMSDRKVSRAIVASRYSKCFFPSLLLRSVIVNLCVQSGQTDGECSRLEIIDIGTITKEWLT